MKGIKKLSVLGLGALFALSLISCNKVLKTSQELRGQVETAKTAYTAAQAVNQATNASGNIGDGLKNQVNKQLDTAKKQLKDEADAWKNVAK